MRAITNTPYLPLGTEFICVNKDIMRTFTYKNEKILIKTFHEIYVVIGNGNLPLPSLLGVNMNVHPVIYVGSLEGCRAYLDKHISASKITPDDLVFNSKTQVIMKNGYFDNMYTLQIVPLAKELEYLHAVNCDVCGFCKKVEELSGCKIYCIERSLEYYLKRAYNACKYYWEEEVDTVEACIYIIASVVLLTLFFRIYY